jgi:hypothetical protein
VEVGDGLLLHQRRVREGEQGDLVLNSQTFYDRNLQLQKNKLGCFENKTFWIFYLEREKFIKCLRALKEYLT